MEKKLIFITGFFGAPLLQRAQQLAEEHDLPLISLDEEIEKSLKKVREAKVIITGRAYEGTVLEMEGCRWSAENQWNIIIRKKDDQVEVLSN